MMIEKKEAGLKSALDLAMERLEKKNGKIAALSAEQKKAIAEIEGQMKAKVAEIEILRNKELAEAFINFYLSYEVQNANALDGVDAPVRMDVVLTEDQVGSFVYGADEVAKLVLPDWSLIAEHQANWINSWNAIFSVK